ncbi:MAG: hypothetical protein P8L45_11290 [Longimicrobiales bacterium]|nr:hypothetical protein [Longimicrobiales bacterium]
MMRSARPAAAMTAGLLLLTAACSSGGSDEAPKPEAEAVAFVPPRDADILVADLSTEPGGLPSIGRPVNLTQRPDYDNQPSFTPDGSGLWYTANDPQSGQSDIWRYDFASGRVTQITSSAPESEYSATPLPDGSGVSVIRVEADSTQRLWRFSLDGLNSSVILPDVAPVGYHKWVDESTIVMFVLGNPATLQMGDLRTGRARVVTEGIGRSIHNIPGTFDVSYVQQHEDGSTTIMRLPGDGGAPEPITETVSNGDFHAWTPNRVLLMADGPRLFARRYEPEAAWEEIADFSDLHINLSRLAVSPDGTQIALVAELDALELPTN